MFNYIGLCSSFSKTAPWLVIHHFHGECKRFLLLKSELVVFQWNWKIERIRYLYYYKVLLRKYNRKEWRLYSATLLENSYGSFYILNLQRINFVEVVLPLAKGKKTTDYTWNFLLQDTKTKQKKKKCGEQVVLRDMKKSKEFKGNHFASMRHILWIRVPALRVSENI